MTEETLLVMFIYYIIIILITHIYLKQVGCWKATLLHNLKLRRSQYFTRNYLSSWVIALWMAIAGKFCSTISWQRAIHLWMDLTNMITCLKKHYVNLFSFFSWLILSLHHSFIDLNNLPKTPCHVPLPLSLFSSVDTFNQRKNLSYQ